MPAYPNVVFFFFSPTLVGPVNKSTSAYATNSNLVILEHCLDVCLETLFGCLQAMHRAGLKLEGRLPFPCACIEQKKKFCACLTVSQQVPIISLMKSAVALSRCGE